MKFNTDPAFVGIENLKQKHKTQIAEFETWAAQGAWERFHYSHYDWWAFPIDQPSSYGFRWVIYEGEVAALKGDPIFVETYRKGVSLVAASWGWDAVSQSPMDHLKTGQSWHQWPIRLYKMAQSVKLFGYDDLFKSLKAYGKDLIKQGEAMSFNGKDLSWIFRQPDS